MCVAVLYVLQQGSLAWWLIGAHVLKFAATAERPTSAEKPTSSFQKELSNPTPSGRELLSVGSAYAGLCM